MLTLERQGCFSVDRCEAASGPAMANIATRQQSPELECLLESRLRSQPAEDLHRLVEHSARRFGLTSTCQPSGYVETTPGLPVGITEFTETGHRRS